MILDASAIVRYVQGGDASIHVGETLVQVADDGVAGLPVLCMAQALMVVGDGFTDRFLLLVEHPATELLAGPEDWRVVAVMMGLVGRWDAAVAVASAIDFEVAVLSAEPDVYAAVNDPYLVIAV